MDQKKFIALKELFPFVIEFKKYIFILCGALLLEAIAAFIVIISITPLAEYVLDSDLTNPTFLTIMISNYLLFIGIQPSFWAFSLVFIFGNFAKAGVDILTRFVCLKIKYQVFLNLSYTNLNIIFKSNWLFFGKSDQGELMNSFQKELNNISETLSQFCQQIAYFIQLIIYFSIPLWINFSLTIIAIGVAIFFMLPFLFLHRFSYALGKKNTETANIMIGRLYELFQCVRLIISHNKQKASIEEYITTAEIHSKAAVESQLFVASTGFLFQPFTILAALMAIGASATFNNNLPETAAVLWGLMRAMPILSKILQSNLNITNFTPSITQLNNIITKAKQNVSKSGKNKIINIKKEIEFLNVNFAYEKRTFELNNINLKIKANQNTALTGVSGSGKSSITDLIIGLQEPNNGAILIDNLPYNQIDLNYFRGKIGYVPQDPQLFNTSIRENLMWFEKNISEKKMLQACETANAMEFIKNLPNGFDTVVGNSGTSFSGGQRQRLTIARALLRKPTLLILDEATSALDSKSDTQIYKSLKKLRGEMTIIIISHKLQTLKQCDMIYVLDNGKIIQNGKFNTLLKDKKNIFYNLMNKQL